ncbi:MAG TPA: ClbS/DfsB family four-helix bundle protein [Candidatus Limnocylindrales bacterium]|nr:ClbS/DfsB family four-helix bundle protein [Candidatus Limnocylindrales bacterium]
MHAELDKAKLLALIGAEYDFAQRTLALLTPEQQVTLHTEGDWTPKDMLCHLIRWLDRLLDWEADAARGVEPAVPEAGYTWREMDALNDVYVEQDRSAPLERASARFAQSHQAVVALIEGMTEDDLFVSTYGGLLREPIAGLVVGCTCEHYAYHVKNLRESLIAQGIL